MIKLRNVKGKYSWCGPSAVSAVTGISSEEAAAKIKASRDCRRGSDAPVTGTLISDLKPTLYDHNIHVANLNIRTNSLAVVRKREWRTRKTSPYSQAACYGEDEQEYQANLDETIIQWCERTIKERGFTRVFLLAAGHHWVLIQGNRFVCGQVRKVTNIWAKGVHRRARVDEVYELSQL